MIGDWVLDHFEEFFLRIRRSDGQSVEKLYHQPSESFEGSWDPHSRADLNEDAFGRVYVNLQLPSLIDGGIKQCEEALERKLDEAE